MSLVVSQLTVDARDPLALARWWSEVLGWRVVEEDVDEIALQPPGDAATEWLFCRVPEAKQGKNRLHVDLRPQDGSSQAAELDRLRALGAVPVDVGQGPDVTWHVLADPEGNEFCLLSRTPAEVAADEG
jgi:catechol 2,3-dioxygenase-like lactoylglutathione lyase family enzyme